MFIDPRWSRPPSVRRAMSRICEVDSTHQRNVDYTDADVVV